MTTAAKSRLNFEVSEDRFLTDMFGPEQVANDVQDLTIEENAIFAESDQFFAENSQLCEFLGFEESRIIAEKVRAGADLATLLGYENVK